MSSEPNEVEPEGEASASREVKVFDSLRQPLGSKWSIQTCLSVLGRWSSILGSVEDGNGKQRSRSSAISGESAGTCAGEIGSLFSRTTDR